MLIDGKDYGTSSVGKGLSRHKLAQQHKDKSKEASDKAGHPAMPEVAGSDAGDHSSHDHAGQEGGHEAIQQVAKEHGPAAKITTTPSEEGHAVETQHEDGHTHSSVGHPSAKHVAEHIGHAAGHVEETEGEAPKEAGGESTNDSIGAMGLGE